MSASIKWSLWSHQAYCKCERHQLCKPPNLGEIKSCISIFNRWGIWASAPSVCRGDNIVILLSQNTNSEGIFGPVVFPCLGGFLVKIGISPSRLGFYFLTSVPMLSHIKMEMSCFWYSSPPFPAWLLRVTVCLKLLRGTFRCVLDGRFDEKSRGTSSILPAPCILGGGVHPLMRTPKWNP